MPGHSQDSARRGNAAATASDIGSRIADRRQQLGLTREDLASRTGAPLTYINHIEEEQAMPGIPLMVRLADSLETTIADLMRSALDKPSATSSVWRRERLVPLTVEECRSLMSTHGVGRIAVVTRSGPAVLPVNYLVTEGRVSYRTAPGSAAAAADGQEVVFEVDHIDDVMRQGWSVNVVGTAHAVPEGAAAHALDTRAYSLPWAGEDRRHWLSIDAERITGRRTHSV